MSRANRSFFCCWISASPAAQTRAPRTQRPFAAGRSWWCRWVLGGGGCWRRRAARTTAQPATREVMTFNKCHDYKNVDLRLITTTTDHGSSFRLFSRFTSFVLRSDSVARPSRLVRCDGTWRRWARAEPCGVIAIARKAPGSVGSWTAS